MLGLPYLETGFCPEDRTATCRSTIGNSTPDGSWKSDGRIANAKRKGDGHPADKSVENDAAAACIRAWESCTGGTVNPQISDSIVEHLESVPKRWVLDA